MLSQQACVQAWSLSAGVSWHILPGIASLVHNTCTPSLSLPWAAAEAQAPCCWPISWCNKPLILALPAPQHKHMCWTQMACRCAADRQAGKETSSALVKTCGGISTKLAPIHKAVGMEQSTLAHTYSGTTRQPAPCESWLSSLIVARPAAAECPAFQAASQPLQSCNRTDPVSAHCALASDKQHTAHQHRRSNRRASNKTSHCQLPAAAPGLVALVQCNAVSFKALCMQRRKPQHRG